MPILNKLKLQFVKGRRSMIGRKLEKQLRSSKKRFVSLGDTHTSFFRPGWETADLINADHIVDFRSQCLPFADQTLDIVHSSHVVEHISNESGLHVFKEIYRCLKPGGTLRISTPDMDLLLDRYRSADWQFFLEADGQYILSRVIRGDLSPESILLHNRLVGWFASYSGRLDTAGGPIVDLQTVENKLTTLSKYDFRDWCVGLLKTERTYAHIHLYDYDELHMSLMKAGFSTIYRSTYRESQCDAMMNPPIDSQKHQIYSLYVEATK